MENKEMHYRGVFAVMKEMILEDCIDEYIESITLNFVEQKGGIVGTYHTDTQVIDVVIERDEKEVFETMAHELRHAWQDYMGKLQQSQEAVEEYAGAMIHALVQTGNDLFDLDVRPIEEVGKNVSRIQYLTSWHEVDATRYASWYVTGCEGEYQEPKFIYADDFYRNDNMMWYMMFRAGILS